MKNSIKLKKQIHLKMEIFFKNSNNAFQKKVLNKLLKK